MRRLAVLVSALFLVSLVQGQAAAEPPDIPPQEPGVTMRVFDVQMALEDFCTLKPGQTPNVDELKPTIDWTTAEDLVQAALLATWRQWSDAGHVEHPYAYVRRVMVTTYLRWTRRRWNGEVAVAALDDTPSEDLRLHAVETHEAIIAALKVLPPKQRAIVVLRYFADLSERQVAEAVGCRVGTVKSQSARALARLREVPGLAEATSGGHHDA